MNEEINIIELLQRVKEGKAPKEIELNNKTYKYNGEYISLDHLYYYAKNSSIILYWLEEIDSFGLYNTKIKILDKPIIEKLTCTDTIDEVKIRINKIIDFINQNNKE